MATTVDAIAQAAFNAVSAAITDAVYSATLSDGTSDYSGRVVFGGETAPAGFPMATAKDKVRPIYLEGFSEVASAGWTITVGSAVYYVLGVRDIAQAGGFQVINGIAATDMLWQTATFQRVTNTTDSLGARVRGWADLASDVSVGIIALSGQERWQSDRVEARSEWRLICEPVSGLREADKVVIDGRDYAIKFVNDVEQRGVWQVLDISLGAAV